MTDKVRADLVLRAMQLLVPLADGSYAAADLTLIDDQVEPTIARLNAEGITYLGDTDTYPPEQFHYLAILLADAVKTDFGLAALPQQEPGRPPLRDQAEEGLKMINAGEPSGAVLAVDYF